MNTYKQAHPLQELVQKQAAELANLKLELQAQKDSNELLHKIGHFPPQFRAGVVDRPDRKPFTFNYRQELKVSSSEPFGSSTQIAQAAFNTDNNNPTHLMRIHFALLRTNHNTPTATIPVNTYLPLAGINDAGLKGLDFIWRVSSSSDDRKWQTNWRDSSDLDFHKGYELVCEQPLYRDDVIIVEAQPHAAADGSETEVFALYCTLHTYKMYEAYPHS